MGNFLLLRHSKFNELMKLVTVLLEFIWMLYSWRITDSSIFSIKSCIQLTHCVFLLYIKKFTRFMTWGLYEKKNYTFYTVGMYSFQILLLYYIQYYILHTIYYNYTIYNSIYYILLYFTKRTIIYIILIWNRCVVLP